NRTYEVNRDDQEWRARLTAEEFHVLREAGTERPFSSPYEHDETKAAYACRACGAELFSSNTKFDAQCGWPSFYSPLAGDRVECRQDVSVGMRRTEVRRATSRSHLGHVCTGEGFGTPTHQRYCINGSSLQQSP